jgi:hypothetical protein
VYIFFFVFRLDYANVPVHLYLPKVEKRRNQTKPNACLPWQVFSHEAISISALPRRDKPDKCHQGEKFGLWQGQQSEAFESPTTSKDYRIHLHS